MRSKFNVPLLLCLITSNFFYGCQKNGILLSLGLANNQSFHAIINNNETITFTTTSPATWSVENTGLGTVTSDGKFTGGNADGAAVLIATSMQDTLLKLFIFILVNHNAEVLKGMINGGYVISFRHTDATLGTDSFGPFNSAWWKSCDSTLARQLTSPKGYNDADSIGKALTLLRYYGVQYDTLFTSEYCRCRQTAEGFKLEGIPIMENTTLTYSVYDEADRYLNTMSLYENLPLNDKNYIAVTHADYTANLPLNPYLNMLQPGDAAVFKKQAGSSMIYVTTITLNDWLIMTRR
jgi:phosphohistidine phosphatase SixA